MALSPPPRALSRLTRRSPGAARPTSSSPPASASTRCSTGWSRRHRLGAGHRLSPRRIHRPAGYPSRQLPPLPPRTLHGSACGQASNYRDRRRSPRPPTETARLGDLIRRHPIDLCFAGIGENGHLAFNDPPADFNTGEPYLVVELDDACRCQQLGEGWFPDFDAVPRRAISMSIRQIMASRQIVLSVPDARKASAVAAAVKDRSPRLSPPASYRGIRPRPSILMPPPPAVLAGDHQRRPLRSSGQRLCRR